jgi:hypothetical protein
MDGRDLDVRYQPVVARRGSQVVLLDLDGQPYDTYTLADALPSPEAVSLCAIECASEEDAARLARWAAQHLGAGLIGTRGLADRLETTTCQPIPGGLYELQGMLGSVVVAEGGTMELVVAGESVELSPELVAAMVPAVPSGASFLSDIE